VLTRRGLLAGLLALPVVRALTPLVGLLPREVVLGIWCDTLLVGPSLPSRFTHIEDPCILSLWGRELERAEREKVLRRDRRYGTLYVARIDPSRLGIEAGA